MSAELQKGNEALNQVREERSQNLETEGNSSEGEMSEDDLESISNSLEKVKLKVEPSGPGPPAEQQKEAQDSTSVRPPDSY